VLVCGEDGKPMPSGVVGELYTGGLGLARGFLNQPELTRQRFVVIDGEQYYRTGDRVHMDADGLLHFHGRLDDQVKIRGNLVETKEVTAALMAVPGVVDAYVRVIGASRTDRTLVAWVVAPNLTERAIRNALREALPGYMWPDHVVRLERLPLNSSGKVDWRTLPQPSQSDSQGGADLSPEQQRLAEIWSEVLGLSVEAIGPDDSFFDLGGNSLRLGVVLGRIGARLGVRLSFADAFTARTLDAMSDAIIATTSTAPPAIPTAAPDRPADLHPQQRSLYAIWRANPESVAYNIPFRLDIRGPLRWERLRAALSEVVAQHDALRMRFILDGDDVRQEPMGAVEPWFEYRDGASGEAVESFVRPFHPDEVPAPRALLVQLSPDRHALYLDVHHIVFDGVSLRLLVDELLDRYAGTFLPKPPVRYVDAAQWCHDRLASGAEQPDESYWLKQFTDVPPALALPTDHPRGSRRAVCGSVIRRELDAGWIGRVVAAARRHRTTEFASLLAAYVAVLGRLTGQRDITVGSPVSGRVHPDFDAVIGMFVSTVCLRIHLDAESTMADLSAQVDKCSREALSHQSYPFERLVKQVAGARDPARNPLFDAFFALQNIEFYEFRKHDLDVSVELLNPGTTRFDLNLQAYLRPDRLVLDLEYATELFERSSADYILDQYLAVLTELVDSPGSPVYRAAIGTSMTSCPDFDF